MHDQEPVGSIPVQNTVFYLSPLAANLVVGATQVDLGERMDGAEAIEQIKGEQERVQSFW